MLGILAAVNPCGFVLLPAYLLYFLGIDSANPAAQRAPIRRALLVSAAVSSGFMLVFLIIGTISRLFTQWIELNAKYAGLLIGIALVVMGLAMLAGWKPSFITPSIGGGRDRSLRTMFIFGIAYAVASIGCTIGFLTTAIFGSIGLHGFASGVISIVLYGVGMGLLVSTLTVTLAVAQGGLLRVLKNGLRYMDKLAAGFIVLTGMYLTWYWYVAVTERTSAGNVTQNIEGWQSSVATFLQRQGAWRLGLVFFVVVGGAILVNQLRSRSNKS
jgi:cytochrome c biogenesis protein CcdA